MINLILASGSPRRRELLKLLGIPFTVVASQIEEKMEKGASPNKVVQSLALQKALYVAKDYKNSCVIGADTVVVLENRIIGKPQNRLDAYNMLKALSGKTHTVFTGVSIVFNETSTTFYEQTDVTFWPLSNEEIYRYIATEQPMDKAGAYGIQDFGALFVKEIAGDFFSVVGLPVSRLYRELKRLGVFQQMKKTVDEEERNAGDS